MRKNLLNGMALCSLLVWANSCSEFTLDNTGKQELSIPTGEVSDSSAFEDFAAVLSKAVSNDKDLRAFIKEKSLEQFDKDYDVFYPFIKDSCLGDGKTFREHLLNYASETELNRIEQAIPKLTILVPDWKWLGAFSVKSWDPANDDIYVGYEQSNERKTVYSDGKIALELEPGEVPGTPTLIVKNNERIRIVSPATKGNDIRYSFSNPAFDGSTGKIGTKGRAWYEDEIPLEYEDIDDFVPTEDIYPKLIEAYNEFEEYQLESACQRDYVYYGMNHSNTNEGILKDYICERFYRFRIDPNGYRTMSDQYNAEGTKNDPKLHETEDIYRRKNAEKFEQNLKDKIWTDGSFELQFDFHIAGADGGTIAPAISEPLAVSASELFYLKCVHKRFKKQTAIATGEYIYTFNIEDLVSRWVNLSNIELPSWDISKDANHLIVTVHELDKATESTYTQSFMCNYSHNF